MLADLDVTLADQTAACLIAERVLLAAVSSLAAIYAADGDDGRDPAGQLQD